MKQLPTIEQTAWVMRQQMKSAKDGGSFRYLIYECMGYGPEAYEPLYRAGGMWINNEVSGAYATKGTGVFRCDEPRRGGTPASQRALGIFKANNAVNHAANNQRGNDNGNQ